MNINDNFSYQSVDVKLPISTLLTSLQKFWGPLLTQTEDSRSKGQDALEELTGYLSNKLRIPREQGFANIEDPTNIFNFNDEIDFWNQILQSESQNGDYKRITE